jgi:hypothetical protein
MAREPWESDPEWTAFVENVREGTLKGIESSAAVISIAPGGEPDIKFAVELGLSIMLDKPLIIVALPGRPIPDRLRRIADRVVEADVDVEEGQAAIKAALEEVLGL